MQDFKNIIFITTKLFQEGWTKVREKNQETGSHRIRPRREVMGIPRKMGKRFLDCSFARGLDQPCSI